MRTFAICVIFAVLAIGSFKTNPPMNAASSEAMPPRKGQYRMRPNGELYFIPGHYKMDSVAGPNGATDYRWIPDVP
jgi:hypothetical protein